MTREAFLASTLMELLTLLDAEADYKRIVYAVQIDMPEEPTLAREPEPADNYATLRALARLPRR